jgi:hypothetical protein
MLLLSTNTDHEDSLGLEPLRAKLIHVTIRVLKVVNNHTPPIELINTLITLSSLNSRIVPSARDLYTEPRSFTSFPASSRYVVIIALCSQFLTLSLPVPFDCLVLVLGHMSMMSGSIMIMKSPCLLTMTPFLTRRHSSILFTYKTY